VKKITFLSVLLVALALSANAQTLIYFTQLSATATPTAIPEGYSGLNWTGIDYVSPLLWSYTNGTIETGDGFLTGPEAMVALGGGPLCYKKHGGQTSKNICSASVAAGVGPNALSQFQPVYAIVSEGWSSDGNQTLIVKAYNNGNLIGSQQYSLDPLAQKFQLVFPSWGPITELKFYPSPGGSFVLYVLGLQ
jgi:hypothetical protein